MNVNCHHFFLPTELVYVSHKAATTSSVRRVERYQQAEWHRSSEGPPGQYGVNRPNKVVDYVSAEEPWKRKKKIPNPTTVIPLDQWTHKHTHMGRRGKG